MNVLVKTNKLLSSLTNPILYATVVVENSLLSLIILGKIDIKDTIMQISDDIFLYSENIKIWSAIKRLYDENAPIDYLHISLYIDNTNLERIVQFINCYPEIYNSYTINNCISCLEFFIKKINYSNRMLELALDIHTTDNLDYTINNTVNTLLEYKETKPINLEDQKTSYLQDLHIRVEAFKSGVLPPTVMSTGIVELDKYLMGGINYGDSITITADTAAGKSTLALQIAYNVTLSNKKVLYFSLEMNAKEMIYRIIVSQSNIQGITSKNIKLGDLTDNQISEISYFTQNINNIIIYDQHVDLDELCIIIQQYITSDDIDLIIVDHLLLIDNPSGLNQTDLLSRTSRILRKMSLKFNIAVIGVSQLSKPTTQEKTKQAVSIDRIKGSSSVGHDSNIVIAITELEVYEDNSSKVELKLLKNRSGESGCSILMKFNKKRYIFEEINNYGITYDTN